MNNQDLNVWVVYSGYGVGFYADADGKLVTTPILAKKFGTKEDAINFAENEIPENQRTMVAVELVHIGWNINETIMVFG